MFNAPSNNLSSVCRCRLRTGGAAQRVRSDSFLSVPRSEWQLRGESCWTRRWAAGCLIGEWDGATCGSLTVHPGSDVWEWRRGARPAADCWGGRRCEERPWESRRKGKVQTQDTTRRHSRDTRAAFHQGTPGFWRGETAGLPAGVSWNLPGHAHWGKPAAQRKGHSKNTHTHARAHAPPHAHTHKPTH